MRRRTGALVGVSLVGALVVVALLRPDPPPERAPRPVAVRPGSAVQAESPGPPEPKPDVTLSREEFARLQVSTPRWFSCGVTGVPEGTFAEVETTVHVEPRGYWRGPLPDCTSFSHVVKGEVRLSGRFGSGAGVLRVEDHAPLAFTWGEGPDGELGCDPEPLRPDTRLAWLEGRVEVPGVPRGGKRWVSGCHVHVILGEDADEDGRFRISAAHEPCWLTGHYFDGALTWSSPQVPVTPLPGEVVQVTLEVDPSPGEDSGSADLGVLAVRRFRGGPEVEFWRFESGGFYAFALLGTHYAVRPVDFVGLATGARDEAYVHTRSEDGTGRLEFVAPW